MGGLSNGELLDKGDALIQECRDTLLNSANKPKVKFCDKFSYYTDCSVSCCECSNCPGAEKGTTIFQFGNGVPSEPVGEAKPLFTEGVPNPFAVKGIPGDAHTPFSAPLWFSKDSSVPGGWKGERLPPFWWETRKPDRDPENPLGFQGHSILR